MSVGTIVACVVLAAGVVGCAAPRGPVPTELLQDCLVGKELKTATNAELTDSLTAVAKTLKLCNEDKKGLRKWATESSP